MNDFADAFRLENIKPNPRNKKMVLDAKYNWNFHSALHSDAGGAFVLSGETFERLHKIESVKIHREIDIFRQRIAAGGVTCVYVGNDVKDTDGRRLLEAIDLRACNPLNKLLIVGEPQAADQTAGQVRQVQERVFRGVVDHLAPYSQADEADIVN